MSQQVLTEEQKKRIEENKLKALAIRIEKTSPVKNNSLSQITPGQSNFHAANSISKTNIYSSQRDTSYTGIPTSQNSKWTCTSAALSNGQEHHLAKGKVPNLHGKCIYVGKNTFSVEIGYHDHLIQYFKQLKTRNYDASTKMWSFKMEEYHTFIRGTQNFQPDIVIDGLPKWIVKCFAANKTSADVEPTVDLSHVDEKLVTALLPFQKDGVKCAIQHNGRLLIADDMGLGKTLQAICVAAYYRNEWPLLIVSPSSVKFDWAQQICRWLPSVDPCDINVVETSKSSFTSGMINILSYDLLSKKISELKMKKFRIVIMDESHFLKNTKTARTQAAMPLLKSAKRVILLSGTPALSRPRELFSQITAVSPNLFTFHEFGVRYCAAKQMQWGWDYSSSSNMVELQALLEEKIMIRREKKDVLSQLPSKYRQVVMLSPSSVHKYKNLKTASNIMGNVKLKGLNKRGVLLEYFQETCKAKLSAVRNYVLDLIEAEKKFLVFAHHKEMLDCIEDGVKPLIPPVDYIRIDGRTTPEQRHFFCSKFQTSDSYKVAILSITAANAGLNLSAANTVVFAELFWNPGILVQAEDRAHRIGQKDSVIVQYLVAQKTADDYIWPLVQSKLDTLSKAGLAKDDFGETDTTRVLDNTQQTLLDMFSCEFIDDTDSDVQHTDVERQPDIKVNVVGLSPEEVDVNVLSSSPLSVSINVLPKVKSPVKSKTPKKSAAGDWTRKIQSKNTVTSSQQEKTPSKRQVSITSFFERTPPRKMLRFDDDLLAATQQPDHCESEVKVMEPEDMCKVTHSPKNHVNKTKMASDNTDSVSRREPGSAICTVMPWLDDDFTLENYDNDKIVASSSSATSDELASQTTQESHRGGNNLKNIMLTEGITGVDNSAYVASEVNVENSSSGNVTQDDLLWLDNLDWDDEM